MEIIVGSVRPLPSQNQKSLIKNIVSIAGRLLHVRPPRKGIAGPSGMERRNKKATDPPKGRVLTILIPDGSLLPSDIDSTEYELSIRLVRK